MFEFFKFFDLLAPEVTMHIQGGNFYFRTFTGSFFTCAYLAIMIAVTAQVANDYFVTTNPVSVGEGFTRAFYPTVNLTENHLAPVFIGYSNELDLINTTLISTYFTVQYQKVTWVNLVVNGSVKTEKHVTILKSMPCSQLEDSEKKVLDYMGVGSSYHQIALQYGICPKLSGVDFTVQGKGSDQVFQLITFLLKPCSLSSGCATADMLATANFQLLVPSTNFNSSDQENPISFVLNADDVYYININLNQKSLVKIKQSYIMDHVGIFPSWTLRKAYFDIGGVDTTAGYRNSTLLSCTSQQILNTSDLTCQSYFEYSFQSSGIIVTNKRTYQSLTTTAGSIGGTNSVVMVLLTMVYLPINKKKRLRFLATQAFPSIFYSDKEENKTFYQKICCCRKKSEKEEKMLKHQAEACERVRSILDVENIVKEANIMRSLLLSLLKSYQVPLLQITGLEAWKKEKLENDQEQRVLDEEMKDKKMMCLSALNERRRLYRMRQLGKIQWGYRKVEELVKRSKREGIEERINNVILQMLQEHDMSSYDSPPLLASRQIRGASTARQVGTEEGIGEEPNEVHTTSLNNNLKVSRVLAVGIQRYEDNSKQDHVIPLFHQKLKAADNQHLKILGEV